MLLSPPFVAYGGCYVRCCVLGTDFCRFTISRFRPGLAKLVCLAGLPRQTGKPNRHATSCVWLVYALTCGVEVSGPLPHPHAACPRIWWGSEIPVDAYTYASSGRTANPKKSKILRLQRIWLILRQRDAGDMGISSHMVPRPETVIGGPKQAKNQISKMFPLPPEPYGGGPRWDRHPVWG